MNPGERTASEIGWCINQSAAVRCFRYGSFAQGADFTQLITLCCMSKDDMQLSIA